MNVIGGWLLIAAVSASMTFVAEAQTSPIGSNDGYAAPGWAPVDLLRPREAEMEYDSVSGRWVELDSATLVERRRERLIEQAKRIFGARWPWVEEPLHLLDSPIEEEAYGLLREGRMREAERVLRNAQRAASDNAEVMCSLADLYATRMRQDTSLFAARKWFRKAESAYQAALRMGRGSHRINFNLSVLYYAYWSKVYEQQVSGAVLPLGSNGSSGWWKARAPLERAYLIDPGHELTAYLLDRWYDNLGLDTDGKERAKKSMRRRLRRSGELH